MCRVGKKDGIDGTNGYFRRSSGCSAEHKSLGIPFRTLPRNRKQLEILFRGTKILGISRSVVPNHSAEEKTTQNITRQPKKVSEKTTFEVRTNHFVKLFCLFCKTDFLRGISFPSSFGTGSSAELRMAQNEHFLPWNNGSLPSLFRRIFSELNSVPNSSYVGLFYCLNILIIPHPLDHLFSYR